MDPRLLAESDPEVLRQALRLMYADYSRLLQQLQDARALLSKAGGKAQLELLAKIDLLQARVAAAKQREFGSSSERRPNDKPVKSPKKQTGHGPREQAELPRVEIEHVVPPSEMLCTSCGNEMATWDGQEETSEQISAISRTFVVQVHRRQKVRCSCGGCIVTAPAPAPAKLREGGRYSVEFAVDVAISKYLDHLPLERQVRMMSREGLRVDSQTLWDQLEALATHLEPTWKRLGEHQRTKPLLYVDETPWLLAERNKAPSRWYAWVSLSSDGAYFELHDTRAATAARSLLRGFSGRVMSDGYAAYQSVQKQAHAEGEISFTHAHCWAHVRRKFVALETSFPAESAHALKLIGDLFLLEREVPEDRRDSESLALRARNRRERTAPIVNEFSQWLMQLRPLPESGLGKAVAYVGRLWPGLTLFLNDPQIPLSNNAAERVTRGPVVGRKNYYGARSERGCQVAAILYSLLESAKTCDLEPRRYLNNAVIAALAGETVALPHEIRAAQV